MLCLIDSIFTLPTCPNIRIITWISIITGCWSAGLRTARSPGVTDPHFVISNGLSEKIIPPTPGNLPDYDSLIAKVSGDFGIKSAVLKAAGQEPEYKGADTLVVPLYIPEGAVPISLARMARSGPPSRTSSSHHGFGSSPIRIISPRRARLPTDEGRRQGGPRRPAPASTPSFLRGWGRRITPRADSRVGLHDDSEPSASEPKLTHIPEIRRTKKNQNSRLSHFTQSSDKGISSSSTILKISPVTAIATTTTPATTITTTTTTTAVPENKSSPASTTRSSVVDYNNDLFTNSKVNGISSTTVSPFLNSTVRMPVINFKTYSSTEPSNLLPVTPKTISSVLNNKREEILRSSTKSNRNGSERRPLPMPRPVQDILGHSSRTSRTSTTKSPLVIDDISEENNKKVNKVDSTIVSRKSRPSRPLLSSRTSEVYSTAPAAKEDKISKEKSSFINTISQKRLPFPPRPTNPGQTSTEQTNNSINNSSRNTTIQTQTKFRLPLLPRKSPSIAANASRYITNNNEDSESDNLPTVTNPLTKKVIDDNKANISPSLTVPIPIRRRRPLRTRIPVPESSKPVPNLSSLTSLTTTRTRPSTTTSTPIPSTTTEKSTTAKRTTTITTTSTATTTTTTTKRPAVTNSPETTSPSTTTTSAIRRIHEFFKISPNKKEQLKSTTEQTTIPTTDFTTASSTTTARNRLRTTPSAVIFPSTHFWHKPIQRTKTGTLRTKYQRSTTPAPSSSKSPAEIVLASLSEVMRDATTGDKDKFTEIAIDLDTLNKQLAERGILIIHAEIDGRIIQLRNYTKNRNPLRNAARGELLLNRKNVSNREEYSSESERESMQSQSLSSTDDTITTIFTPSDKLEYDLVLKNDDGLRGSHDGLTSTYYAIQNRDEQTEKINEVSTTKFSNKATRYTTIKPNSKVERTSPIGLAVPSSEKKYDRNVGSPNPVTQKTRQNERNLERQFSNNTLGAIKMSILESETERLTTNRKISATSTIPTTITTRSRTTIIPVSEKHTPTNVYTYKMENDPPPVFNNNPNNEEASASSEEIIPQYIKPSSHMRPKISNVEAEVILEPSPAINDTSSTKQISMFDHQEKENDKEESGSNELNDLLMDEEVFLNENEIGDLSASSADEEPNVRTSSSGSSVYLVGMVGIFPLAGVAAYVVRRFLRGESHQKALPESEERPDGFTPPTHHHARSQSLLPPLPEPKCSTLTDGVAAIPQSILQPPSPWEFTRSKLRLVSILGEGNFGVVWKAEARGFCDYAAGGSTVLVAVKKVKENAGAKEKCDLLRELSVMQLLGPHPNVVSLLGCCTQTEPHLLIMEYVMFGKLLTFLRDHRTRHNYFNFSSDTAALTSRDLTRFACQVATGCDYLQSRGIIHRDLAARNILVDHNKVCKIADFGMARSIQDIGSDIYEQKSKGALPIRWMAPESLYMNIFTHKSDVWSFGILCWEIVTLGSTPYPGLTAREVMRQVTEGYRLERPDHCRTELYRLLATCWQQDLNKRPTFHQLKIELNTLLEHQTGYIDLENFPEEDYFSMHQNNEEKL